MSSILDAVTKDAQRSGKIPDADGQPPRDPGKGGGRFRSTAIVVILGLLIGAGASRMLGGSDEAVEDDLLTDKVASRAKTSTPSGEGPVAPVPPADADEIAVAAKPSPDARGKARKDVVVKEEREKQDAKGGRRADRKDERAPGHVGDAAKVVAGTAPAAATPPVAMPAAAPPPPVKAPTSIPAPAAAAAPVVAALPPVTQPSIPIPTPSAPAAAPAVTATKKTIPPPALVPPAAPVPSPAPAVVAPIPLPSPAPAAPPQAPAPTQVATVSNPVVAAPPAPVVPVVAKPISPPVPPPAVKVPPPPPSPAVVDQAFRSVVADEVAPAAPPARPLLEAKPEGAPEVFILFVAWSKKPAERLVSMRVGTGPLNVVHEGESVEGLQIATIHPESVDLVWTGRAYRVPMREF